MGHGWLDFLRSPAPSAHGAQVYADVDELAASVAEFLASGFAVGDPGVVIAVPAHAGVIAERLASSGWDPEQLERRGELVVVDAEETLTAISLGGRVVPAAFERVVGGLIDRFADRHVRAFGEMVDLLTRRGEHEAAMALEDLWNMLARSRRFSLLCGYRLDVFDPSTQAGPLPGVCAAHSHVLPAIDPDRLGQAVDLALADVLGRPEADAVAARVLEEGRRDRVPPAQLVLMWVSEHMPGSADRILAAARTRYAAV